MGGVYLPIRKTKRGNFTMPLFATPAPAVDAVPAGEVGKAREVLAFLNGEGPLDGLYFDESDRPERPRYWWRAHLAALSHGEGRK